MTRRKKLVLFTLAAIALLVALGAGILMITVQSDWFKNQVRQRIVAVAEKATGGRVEIGRFNYDWHALTVELSPFVLHGYEPPSAPPFFRAHKIQIGLKIISAFKKQVDIASVTLEKPQVYVAVAPDGNTNVPSPKITGRSGKNFIEQLLDLKVRHFELRDGSLEYNFERTPFDIQGDHLQVSLAYESAAHRFVGAIQSRPMRISSSRLQSPVTFSLDSKLALESKAIQVLEADLAGEGWKAGLHGSISDFSALNGQLDVTASGAIKDLKKPFALPLESRGDVSLRGQATFTTRPFRYSLEGRLTARDLGYAYKDVAIRNIALESPVRVDASGISLPKLELSALQGRFHGSAQVRDFTRLSVNGTAEGFSLKELAVLSGRQTGELNGIVSGTVQVDGRFTKSTLTDVNALAKIDIAPGTGGVPLQGALTIDYDQRAGKIQLSNSQLHLGSTQVLLAGTLGQSLTVGVNTRNFNDLLPLMPLFGEAPPEQLPIALHGGNAKLDAVITGPLANPRILGNADIGAFALDRTEFDRLTTAFEIDRSGANFRTLALDQGKMRVEGQARVSLQDWKLQDSSSVSALLAVRGADVQTLASQADWKAPLTGSAAGTVHVSGSFESPLVNATVEASNVTAYDEHLDSARADVTYTATALEVTNGDIRSGPAQIKISGGYNHPAKDWNDGSLRFELETSHLSLTQIKHVQDFRQGLIGELDVKGSGAAKVVNSSIDLTSLNGELSLRNAELDGRRYGDLKLTANTRLPVLTLAATVNFGGIQLQGDGEWRMEGDYPGQARIQIPRVPFATLHDLAPGPHLRKELPFEGYLQGEATITGPLNRVGAMKANIALSTVQLNASTNTRPMAGAQPQDLVLRNAQPVRLEATTKSIDIRNASFTAKDTTLNLAGRLALDSKTPWDLAMQGRINLSILQIFNPDLLGSGVSVINVAVRGALTEPQVDGRLELQNASLFVRDLPNGVDRANGLILFDRNRATVQNLSAVTGGGDVTFETGSFVGFRGPALLYHLQASARNVRYRSSDGVSITANATLSLSGTSDKSVLSGAVTVIRTSFNPRTDVGALLAATAKPVSAPSTPNEYLRGIQFDVQILSERTLQIVTSLTHNIEADASLRLRGTPERPVILGNVSVNSGQIEFFGNKYTISRGEINFYNPVKIEPIIDMELGTHVRGIAVDISFSGPLNKLNFSYRSDPPLEANQIIALLAVGRAPSSGSLLASGQTTTNTNYLATGSNALLGQAIAPATGRLQKFFGVSHIKIDPQLTDVTAVPQARLTLEQQISTDITLTYITNLAVTNQQIVRVEWDFSKRWSVVALRDENGAFGIDFQYRKRFK